MSINKKQRQANNDYATTPLGNQIEKQLKHYSKKQVADAETWDQLFP